MDQIRIIVVEDDTDWMKTITKFLSNEDDFLIVGTATSKADSVKLAKSIDFDIILMDINLSGDNYDGINAAQEILEFRNKKILMLTCINDVDVIKNSFTAGAVNYMSKDNYRELPGVIRNCLNDNSPLNVMLQEYARLKEQEQLMLLSDAEKEVYGLIEKGHSRADLQKILMKSENTIKKQIKGIFKKLGVKSSQEAVRKVKRKGLK